MIFKYLIMVRISGWFFRFEYMKKNNASSTENKVYVEFVFLNPPTISELQWQVTIEVKISQLTALTLLGYI